MSKKPQAVASSTPAGASAAAAPRAPKSAGTVTVASKLQMSVTLQLCKPQTKSVAGRYGSEPETIYFKTGPEVIIRGTGYPNGKPPARFPRRPEMVGGDGFDDGPVGFALTPGIPADWWDQWLEQNRETEIVRSGHIYAHSSHDFLEGYAEEHAGSKTGFEPINPADTSDPRIPRPMNAQIGAVSEAEV